MTSGEDELIARIRRRIPSRAGGALRRGIGDDAAVVRPARGTEWVLSSDQFIEDVHFLTAVHAPEVVGYKALARATSDLAAMGARPRLFLLNLQLPASRTGSWLDRLLTGMARGSRRFGITLAGGDTARSVGAAGGSEDGKVALSLTVLGEMPAGLSIGRSGARPGDAIFVTGKLGEAQLGLELILRGLHRRRRWAKLFVAHNHPKPCLALGRWLAQHRAASAMMDLSDGLSIDLARLCQASRVGARLMEDHIPAVTVPPALLRLGLDGRTLALNGGEDYGLLFTVPKSRASQMQRRLQGTRITRIGEIVRGSGIQLVGAEGSSKRLLPRGWDHFATVPPNKRPSRTLGPTRR